MLHNLKLAWTGFCRFRERRRNLTIVLVCIFFLMCFFTTIFLTLFNNMEKYWLETVVGGDLIVAKTEKRINIFRPIEQESYFSYSEIKDKYDISGKLHSPRLRVPVVIENGDYEKGLIVLGVDPEKERSVTPNLDLAEGRYIKEGAEICISQIVAGQLGVAVGDEVIIFLHTKDGYVNVDFIKVTGIIEYETINEYMGSGVLGFVPIEHLRSLQHISTDDISEIVCRDLNFLQKWRIVRDYNIIDGLATIPILVLIRLFFRFFLLVFFLLIVLIAFSSSYNNIQLSIGERQREMGVYLSFGAQPGMLKRLFNMEMTIYSIYCCFMGSILSTLAFSALNRAQLYTDFSPVFQVFLSTSHFTVNYDFRVYLLSSALIWIVLITSSSKIVDRTSQTEEIVKALTRR